MLSRVSRLLVIDQVSEIKKVDQAIDDIAASKKERQTKLKQRHASAAAQRAAHLQDKVHKAVNHLPRHLPRRAPC